VTCPCCLPNNNIGFTCADGVRLAPLPANATFGLYYARLQPQPGHTQCQACRKHLPMIPEAQGEVADRFRCKFQESPQDCHQTAQIVPKRSNYLLTIIYFFPMTFLRQDVSHTDLRMQYVKC
jgi:hypothetical protein